MMTPVLPESAPFSSEQRHWLNGFLAGLTNAKLANGEVGKMPVSPGSTDFGPLVADKPAVSILILFGSQSGTAEGLAQALADKLKAFSNTNGNGLRFMPRVLGMDRFLEINWATENHILMLTSTWGDGDMPDNAVAFWDWLKAPAAPSMAHVSFAVLGLGDRNYARYCQAGKNLSQRFSELGAKALLPLCECDTDYEGKSEQWMLQTLAALETVVPVDSSTPKSSIPTIEKAPAPLTSSYSRKNPFPAPLIENHPLNAKGSAKDTRHFSLSLLGSGLEYKVGDALGVFPQNCYDLVDRIILTLNCIGSEKVTLDGGEEVALRAGLISKFDLRRGSERLLFNIRQTCTNLGEKIQLDELLGEDGAKARPYLMERDVLDVLQDFSHTRLEPQLFVSSLGKISPRLYSISSSPKENPGEVHLTVAVVRYSIAGRRRIGVASSYLAERVPLGMTVPVFIQPTAHFTLPSELGRPIIMVGPGTGVAPFRAFLQERQQIGDPGKNWLFFGDQRRQFDFLYSEEFVAMQTSGFLTRLDLAFSRDQEEKIYVQTLMLEQAKELYNWLEAGASFYVCGDAKRMAKDVEEALLQVIAKESGRGLDAAREYLANMKSQKRYQRDVY